MYRHTENEAIEMTGLKTRTSSDDLATYVGKCLGASLWAGVEIERGRSTANPLGRAVRLLREVGMAVTIEWVDSKTAVDDPSQGSRKRARGFGDSLAGRLDPSRRRSSDTTAQPANTGVGSGAVGAFGRHARVAETFAEIGVARLADERWVVLREVVAVPEGSVARGAGGRELSEGVDTKNVAGAGEALGLTGRDA